MAQFAAVMLALMAGSSLGLTAASDGRPEVAIETAVALALFRHRDHCPAARPARGADACWRRPSAPMLWSIFPIVPGFFPISSRRVGSWSAARSANLCVGVLCYLPMLRR